MYSRISCNHKTPSNSSRSSRSFSEECRACPERSLVIRRDPLPLWVPAPESSSSSCRIFSKRPSLPPPAHLFARCSYNGFSCLRKSRSARRLGAAQRSSQRSNGGVKLHQLRSEQGHRRAHGGSIATYFRERPQGLTASMHQPRCCFAALRLILPVHEPQDELFPLPSVDQRSKAVA